MEAGETIVFRTGLIWDADLVVGQLQAAGIGAWRRDVHDDGRIHGHRGRIFQQDFGEGVSFEIVVPAGCSADARRIIEGLGLAPQASVEHDEPEAPEEAKEQEEKGYQAYQTRAGYVEQSRLFASFYVIACAVLTVIMVVIGFIEWRHLH